MCIPEQRVAKLLEKPRGERGYMGKDDTLRNLEDTCWPARYH